MNKRAGSTLLSAGLFGAVVVLVFAANLVVSNAFGKDGLGNYLFILNLAQIGALLTGTTLGMIGITSLPQKLDTGGQPAAATMIASLSRACLAGSLLVGIVVALIAFRLGGTFALAGVFCLFGVAFQNLTRDVLRGMGLLRSSYSVLMIAPLTIMMFAGITRSNQHLPIVITVSYAIVLTASLVWIRRLSTGRPRDVPLMQWRAIGRLIGPTIAIAASQSILSRTDVLILRLWAGAADAAEMGAAVTAGGLTALGLGAANAVYVPRLSRAKPAERRRLLTESQIIGGATAAVILLAILLTGERAFLLFGDGFEPALPLFKILAIGAFANAVTGPVAYLGIATGRASTVAWVTTGAAAINLTADLLVFPSFGSQGLAIVTTTVAVAMNLTLLWFARTWCSLTV